jgi:hypothetical protein
VLEQVLTFLSGVATEPGSLAHAAAAQVRRNTLHRGKENGPPSLSGMPRVSFHPSDSLLLLSIDQGGGKRRGMGVRLKYSRKETENVATPTS